MKKQRLRKQSVKEAMDNLPDGICFFDSRDILVLCNKQMYRLGFAFAERELQSREAMDRLLREPTAKSGILRDGEIYLLPDGTAWSFQKRQISDSKGNVYTEYLAIHVTELYRRKQELERRNAERREVMQRLTHIADNVVAITREEEILSLKMKIHHDLGCALQSTGRFFAQGCPKDAKAAYLEEQRRMAGALQGEVGNDDEVDVYEELCRIAERLDLRLITTGEIPEDEEVRNLLSMAVRECLTNTVRHADGTEVCVVIQNETDRVTAVITNNGKPPKCQVTEGGGLSSLRKKLERFGGRMQIISLPRFEMTVELPKKRRK